MYKNTTPHGILLAHHKLISPSLVSLVKKEGGNKLKLLDCDAAEFLHVKNKRDIIPNAFLPLFLLPREVLCEVHLIMKITRSIWKGKSHFESATHTITGANILPYFKGDPCFLSSAGIIHIIRGFFCKNNQVGPIYHQAL